MLAKGVPVVIMENMSVNHIEDGLHISCRKAQIKYALLREHIKSDFYLQIFENRHFKAICFLISLYSTLANLSSQPYILYFFNFLLPIQFNNRKQVNLPPGSLPVKILISPLVLQYASPVGTAPHVFYLTTVLT